MWISDCGMNEALFIPQSEIHIPKLNKFLFVKSTNLLF
jgi:hypothetical protein